MKDTAVAVGWAVLALLGAGFVLWFLSGCAGPETKYYQSRVFSVIHPTGSVTETWAEERTERPRNWPLKEGN